MRYVVALAIATACTVLMFSDAGIMASYVAQWKTQNVVLP